MYSAVDIEEILQKFQIEPADLDRIRAAGVVLRPQLDAVIAEFYAWMPSQKEYETFFGQNPKRLERVMALQKTHWITFFDANINHAWFAARVHVGAMHAHINLHNDMYFGAMSQMARLMVARLHATGDALPNALSVAESVMKLVFLDSFVVIEEIARSQRDRIAASSQALMELSTPVTPIWEGILLLPLLGIVDSSRTQEIMNKTLNEISRTRARVFVMDISGVSAMDTAVANQLMKVTRATRLMGCETILSGISPAIARTLVELGVNLGEVRTTATLRDSFEIALRVVGVSALATAPRESRGPAAGPAA